MPGYAQGRGLLFYSLHVVMEIFLQASYCDKRCQKLHWSTHKRTCKQDDVSRAAGCAGGTAQSSGAAAGVVVAGAADDNLATAARTVCAGTD